MGNMSVHEACKTVIEKLADGGGSSGGKDHGIFKPLTEDSGTKGGKWLKPEKTLDFYDLKSNVLYFVCNFTDSSSQGTCRIS
jgi:hypothetical protein